MTSHSRREIKERKNNLRHRNIYTYRYDGSEQEQEAEHEGKGGGGGLEIRSVAILMPVWTTYEIFLFRKSTCGFVLIIDKCRFSRADIELGVAKQLLCLGSPCPKIYFAHTN